MENLNSTVDLIRALAKKCDDLEYYKNQYEAYQGWYKEERDRVAELREEVDKLKRILDEANLDY